MVVIHLVDAVAGGGDQNVAVAALDDTVHEGSHPLSRAIDHGHIFEVAVYITLQRVRHTYIYSAPAGLHDAVYTVVGQSM